MIRSIVLLLLINSYLVHAELTHLESSLLFNSPFFLYSQRETIHSPLDTSQTNLLHFQIKRSHYNIYNSPTTKAAFENTSTRISIPISETSNVYSSTLNETGHFQYHKSDSSLFKIRHDQFRGLIGGFVQPTPQLLFQGEYSSNSKYTVGLGYTPYLFFRYTYQNTTVKDSITLWNYQFDINNYPTINALYQNSKRLASLEAHGQWNKHLLIGNYSEGRISPKRPSIDHEPVDSAFYWFSDSTQQSGFKLEYQFQTTDSFPVIEALTSHFYCEAQTKGRLLSNNPPPHDRNIKIFHFSSLSSESHAIELQTLFKFSPLYRISAGIQYTQYSIQNNPLDSTNRNQDFIRYNQLFQPNTGAILIGGLFKQSDMATFNLAIDKYTVSIKHTWQLNKMRLSLSHPINMYHIETQLKKTTLIIPTTMFGSTTISDSLSVSGNGFIVTTPLEISGEYSFSNVSIGFEATQIIPIYNNFRTRNRDDLDEKKQSNEIKMTKNGFYGSVYLKLFFN